MLLNVMLYVCYAVLCYVFVMLCVCYAVCMLCCVYVMLCVCFALCIYAVCLACGCMPVVNHFGSLPELLFHCNSIQ